MIPDDHHPHVGPLATGAPMGGDPVSSETEGNRLAGPQNQSLTNGYSESELYQMEQFASQYAFGMPIGRAVSHAGYGTSSVVKGFELLQIPFVQHVINQTREWIKGRLADDINSLLMQLDQDRAFAYLMENPSAAVTATNSKAKLLGLLDPDKSNRLPAKITIEWDSQEDVTVIDHKD